MLAVLKKLDFQSQETWGAFHPLQHTAVFKILSLLYVERVKIVFRKEPI